MNKSTIFFVSIATTPKPTTPTCKYCIVVIYKYKQLSQKVSDLTHPACKLQKRCTRLATASDKAYQLLAHGRWFSPGTPTSSTTKSGCHDIAEILLKVALNTKIKLNL
jgi:hypothetical protein